MIHQGAARDAASVHFQDTLVLIDVALVSSGYPKSFMHADVTVVVCFPSCPVSAVGECSRGEEFLPESSSCIGESFPESAKPGSGDSTAIG